MKKYNLIHTFILSSFFICSFFTSSFVHANSISLDESFLLDTIPEQEIEIFEEKEEPIFMLVQEGPRFPGCEDMEGSKKEKESCAKERLNKFIYENLKYPVEARKNNIEGENVIQFVVEKDGSISNIDLIRDIGDGCGEESLRIVEEMKNLPEKWTPGKQRGRAVRVKYTLPVKFKLDDRHIKKKRRN